MANDRPDDHDELMLINGGYVSIDGLDKTPVFGLDIADRQRTEAFSKQLQELIEVAEEGFFSAFTSVDDYVISIYEEYKKSSYLGDVIAGLTGETIRTK